MLMKDRITDRLKPEVGIVVGKGGHSDTSSLEMEESLREINHTSKLLIQLWFHSDEKHQ